MATVSFRVPPDLKEKMDEYEDINWSAILRRHLENEIATRESRNLAHAVATSDRLSQQIDATAIANKNTADVIRRFRDTRYGTEPS